MGTAHQVSTDNSARTIRVKEFAGIRWLLEEPPEDVCTCPRCGVPLEPYHGILALDREYEVWQIPICKKCEEELNQSDVPLSDRLVAIGLLGKLQGMKIETFTVENHRQERAKKTAIRYIADPTTNLWLYGSAGTGKTHLAAAIVHALVGSGRSMMFVYVPTLLDDLRDSYRSGNDSALEQSEPARVDLLVLDDLGVEKRTDWAAERLNTVVNYRNVHRKPTVVTSNHSPDGLAERLDGRLVSRLMDNGKAINLGDDDWRIRNSVKKANT
jgi:DNA replication protein DnaC